MRIDDHAMWTGVTGVTAGFERTESGRVEGGNMYG